MRPRLILLLFASALCVAANQYAQQRPAPKPPAASTIPDLSGVWYMRNTQRSFQRWLAERSTRGTA